MGEDPGRLTVRLLVPRSRRAALRGAFAALVSLGGALAGPAEVRAQQPDTVVVRLDTLRADTLPPARPLPADSLDPEAAGASGDSVSADTIFYNLPDLAGPRESGFAQGAWVWEREDIMVSGAVTLAELVATVPGLVPLLTGDYGTPLGVTAFGLGGGGVRVLRDGFEMLPLEGGVADLARIGLVGISRVRLDRTPGELVFRLESHRHTDGRAYSLVEAGTGDLNTNLFRGTFADPVAVGGSLAVGLERADSRGARGDEAGSVTGSWLRYQLHRGDAAGIALEYRGVGSETAARPYAAKTGRTDWTVRGRARLAEGVVVEAYGGKSSHEVEDERAAYAAEGGSRSQMGVRGSLGRDGLHAQVGYRRFGGDGLPSSRLEASAGAESPRWGGVGGELDRTAWPGLTTGATRVRGWTRPVLGIQAFGSWESGTWGARAAPLASPVEGDSADAADPADEAPLFHVSDRTATRFGALWGWRGLAVSGALLEVEADSLLPLGIEPDRGTPALAGGTRAGWEVWGRIPLPVEGLRVEGSLQQWEEDWSYLPRRNYTGALVFHRTYLESGNLEWWWTVGVRGHDAMTVRQVAGGGGMDEDEADLAEVPSYQNWYARIQLRIVSVRIFVGWENFTVRRDLENFPGRLLPATRAVYGLRWTLWN